MINNQIILFRTNPAPETLTCNIPNSLQRLSEIVDGVEGTSASTPGLFQLLGQSDLLLCGLSIVPTTILLGLAGRRGNHCNR